MCHNYIYVYIYIYAILMENKDMHSLWLKFLEATIRIKTVFWSNCLFLVGVFNGACFQSNNGGY